MLGGLSLVALDNNVGSGGDAIDVYPALGAVGEFLVCLTMIAPTERAATMMVDVTRLGTGITTPEDVFRTRHVQRGIWTVQDWRTTDAYNGTTNETTITWGQGGTARIPMQRWGSPFVKPINHPTATAVISGVGVVAPFPLYLEELMSPLPADRYGPTSGVYTEPDPIFFTCRIGDGQYLRFETKYYEDDPFRIDPTFGPTDPTPILIDDIPTTADPSASEVEVSSSTGSISVWMLRV